MMFPIRLPTFMRGKKPVSKLDYYSRWLSSSFMFILLIVTVIGLFFSYMTIEVELNSIGEFTFNAPALNLTLNELGGRVKIQAPLYVLIGMGIGNFVNNIQLPDLSPPVQISPIRRYDVNQTDQNRTENIQ